MKKNSIIQCISIYTILCMYILLQKPKILYDESNNIKSLDYFNNKIKYGFNNLDELICLPTIFIIISLLSFIISVKL